MPIPRFWGDDIEIGANQVVTASIADGAVNNAKVAANAAIAGSKLQALSVGVNAGALPITGVANAHVSATAAIAATKIQALDLGTNGGVLPSTGVANAHVAADAAIVGSKLAAAARTRHIQSEAISLTNAGAATVSKAVFHTTKAITITAVRLVYETASNAGSVPNVELGINGALTQTVAAVAAEANKAAWFVATLTIANPAIAANKTIVFSTVAGAETTNTGAVRIAIEYTIDD